MTSRTASAIRIITLIAICSGLFVGCARTPREHWWQFWRPRGQVTNLDDQFIPGPPGERDFTVMDDSSFYPQDGSLSPDFFAIDPDENLIGLPEPEPIRQDPDGIIVDLIPIYFAYDSFSLTSEGEQALRENAQWIAGHPGLDIRIEGHCDERGTEEYNYNLGQKRAQTVREALARSGIEEGRLFNWSWGELRPIAAGENEAAWSQNRRVQFAVWSTDEE